MYLFVTQNCKYLVQLAMQNIALNETKCQCCPYIETSQLICSTNQLTGFYTRATLALNGLNKIKD